MNSLILPPALTTMPHPWHISSDEKRRDAVAQLSQDAPQRSTAVTALERCLAFLVDEYSRHGDEAPLDLPADFYDSWIFFEPSFDERMPTLGAVTADAIRQWIKDDPDTDLLFGTNWMDPPSEIITAVAQFWAATKARRICEQLMNWLRESIWRNPDAAERQPMLTALEGAAPRLDSRTGQIVIGVVWDLGGTRELNFLASVERDFDAPEETRMEAARLRELVEKRAEESSARRDGD